jgi:hypothetical protein
VSREAISWSWITLPIAMPSVSISGNDIETDAVTLAQRQQPRALQRFNVDAKVHKPASMGSNSSWISRPASDPRSLQWRASRGVMSSAEDSSRLSVPMSVRRQLWGRTSSTQRDRRFIRFNTQRSKDRFGQTDEALCINQDQEVCRTSPQ